MLWTHRELVECVRSESRRSRDRAHSSNARQCEATLMSALQAATAASNHGIESPVRAECVGALLNRNGLQHVVGVELHHATPERCLEHVMDVLALALFAGLDKQSCPFKRT